MYNREGFVSPKFQRETLFQQGERIEQELEDNRLEYALTIGNEALRWISDRKFGGKSFDLLSARAVAMERCERERVAPEYVSAVVDLVCERYERV